MFNELQVVKLAKQNVICCQNWKILRLANEMSVARAVVIVRACHFNVILHEEELGTRML